MPLFFTDLQLQREGDPLCSTMEAPGTLAQTVESRHLVLQAQTRPGHQRASTQEYMVTTSIENIK